MNIQEVFATIDGNLVLDELSYVSLHPKNNFPEQMFCKHLKRKHSHLLNTIHAIEGPILWSPYATELISMG